jgi:hypothetical protein
MVRIRQGLDNENLGVKRCRLLAQGRKEWKIILKQAEAEAKLKWPCREREEKLDESHFTLIQSIAKIENLMRKKNVDGVENAPGLFISIKIVSEVRGHTGQWDMENSKEHISKYLHFIGVHGVYLSALLINKVRC